MATQSISYTKPTINKKDLVHVLECMITDKIEEGELTGKFETMLGEYLDYKQILVVNSAQSALFLICKFLNLSEKDEVILPAWCEPYILETIIHFKAIPVLVDLAEKSYCMDYDQVKEKCTERTKIILVSHLFGYPADISPLEPLRCEGMYIVEDCSHSLGSRLNEEHTGKAGDFSFFSFSANRIITSGEGGAIGVKVKKHLGLLKDLRSYKKQTTLSGRINCSITDLQAALGLSELSYISKFLERRKQIGENYTKNVFQGKNNSILPNDAQQVNYAYFIIQLNSSLKIAREMFKKYKVEVVQPFIPLYTLLELPDSAFPNTQTLYLKSLALPIYPLLEIKEIKQVEKLISSIR